MNKIYKVLWNRARSTHVVTDEAKTAHGKGRSGVLSSVDLTTPLPILSLAASLFLGLSGSAWGTDITAASGWNHTTISNLANRWEISTDKVINKTGINRFDKFNLSQGHIANLQMGEASRLLNLVNQKITVDGVVNAVKNQKIDGDLIFVSPAGMAIGTTGVINAGSLTAVVPKQATYDDWVGYTESDDLSQNHFTDDFFTQLQNGNVPLNPAGVITVEGSINAGNRIALAAQTVELKKGAKVQTGVSDFSKLVNITDEHGSITADSGLSKTDGDLSFEIDKESGDILLVARADSSSITDSSSDMTLTASVNAAVTVSEGAEIHAARDVAIRAEAGNGEYDVVTSKFQTSEDERSADVAATVEVNGAVTADRDLTVSADAYNLLSHDSTYNLAAVSENIQGVFLGGLGGSTVEWVDMSAKSQVTIGETAKLQANRDATLQANTKLDLQIGDSTGFLNYTNFVNGIPVVAVAAAQAEASSTVTVNGSVRAGEDLTLKADTDFDVEVMTKAMIKEQGTELSFVYADLDSSSSVNINESAQLGALETKDSLGNVQIVANTANRVETAAETYVYQEGKGSIGIAVNATLFDSSADVNLQSGLDGTASMIDVSASNTTETFDILSKTTTGDLGIMMKLQAKAVKASMDKILGEVIKKVDGVNGAKGLRFNLGGSVAYIENQQSADVTVSTGKEALRSSGNLTIKADSVLDDYHYEVTTKEVIDDSSTAKGQGAVSVLVAQSTNGKPSVGAFVTVADEATLESTTGDLKVSSRAEINKDRWQFLTEELKRSFDTLKSYFEEGGAYQDNLDRFNELSKDVQIAFEAIPEASDFTESLQQLADAITELTKFLDSLTDLVVDEVSGIGSSLVSIGFDVFDIVNPASYTNAFVSAGGVTNDAQKAPVSIAASIGVIDQSTDSSVTIGRGATLTAKNVDLSSTSQNEGVAMGGYLDNFLGVPLPNRDNAKALGATVVYQSLQGDSNITVREGAKIVASNDLTVTGTGEIDAVTIAASAGYNKGGLTLSGLAAVTKAKGDNLVQIDDEASLSAENDLAVQAQRNDSIQTVAAGLNLGLGGNGANASVGAGVAVNLGGVNNAVEFADNDGGISLYDSVGELTANAVRLVADADVNVNAIGVEGQAAISSNTSDAETTATATDKLEGLGEGDFDEEIVDQELMQLIWSEAQSQNGFNDSDLGWLTEGAESRPSPTEEGKRPNIGADGAAGRGMEQASKSKNALNLAAAGSFAWNDLDVTNKVTISSASDKLSDQDVLSIDSESLQIDALTDKWMGSFAGAAGISVVTGGSATVNGSIGGAAAINKNVFENAVTIAGLQTSARTMSVSSLVNGTTVAEGLGLSVAGGKSSASLGIDAGVSYNYVDNTISTSVSRLTNTSDDFVYEQAAWTGETQVTGGTGVGVAAGGTAFSGAFGAAVAVADIKNEVTSALSKSNLSNVSSADVLALASLTQVNTAISAQVAEGSGVSVGLSGAVIHAGIDNQVSAGASDSTITVKDGGSVDIRAATANTGAGGEAQQYAERVQGVDGIVSRDDLIDVSLTEGITLKESEDDKTGHDMAADYLNGADMMQVSVALGVDATKSGNVSAAGAAGVLVSDLTNKFSSDVSNLEVKKAESDAHFTYSQTAASGVSTVNVAAGIAAAGGGSFDLSLAGSVVVSGVNQMTTVSADYLTLEADSTKADNVVAAIGAQNDVATVNVAGNASVSIGNKGAGVGAAVVVTDVQNTADTTVSNSDVTGGGILAVTAENSADTWAAAANATVAGSVSIGGSFARNVVANNAGVHITDTTLEGLNALYADAQDDSLLRTLAGSISVSYGPKSGSFAGGIAFADAGGVTKAEVAGLTIRVNDESSETDLLVDAAASDDVKTLTIGTAVTATLGAAFANATAVNAIDRTVNASLQGLSVSATDGSPWEGARRLGDVSVKALSEASISNLGIVLSVAGEGAGIGAGVALNEVGIHVDATGKELEGTLDTLDIEASSANTINTIGVGVSAGAAAGVGGSVATAELSGNVNATLLDSTISVDGAAAVHAKSDDTVGLYGGQASAAGNTALGVSVGIVDRTGLTTASVSNTELFETGNSNSTLLVEGGIEDDEINDKVVQEVDAGSSLADKRLKKDVSGILVSATSTSTYKSLVLNGGGSASNQAAGSGLTITHAGSTASTVSGSTLSSASETGIFAGDYANIFTSLTNVGGAGTASANLGVSLVETGHQTSASADDAELQGSSVSLLAESKEGVSSFMTAGSGAMSAAGAATAAVTDLLSGTSTALTGGSTVRGENYLQQADYLGRISNLGASAALSMGASAGANVVLNTAKNFVSSFVDGSRIESSGKVDVLANRDLEWKEYGGVLSVAVGQNGLAASGTVAVNTIDGETAVKLSNAAVVGTDETDEVNIAAENNDDIDITYVTASASTFGALGATVVVNEVTDTAGVAVDHSSISANAIEIGAEQNRNIDGTLATAVAALTAGISANVVATTIGEAVSDYNALLGGEAGAGAQASSVKGFIDEYGNYDKKTLLDQAQGVSRNVSDSNDATAQAQSDNEGLLEGATGTRVYLTNADLTGTTISVRADEDVEGSGVDVTLGSGSAGAISASAGVAVLNRHHNAGVSVTGGQIIGAEDVGINASVGSHDHLVVWQAGAGLVSGTAAYAEENIKGEVDVTLQNASIASNNTQVAAENVSEVTLESNGLAVGGVAAGGMIAKICDASSAAVSAVGTTLTGSSALRADRGQTLYAKALAGYGGAAAGVGAQADVNDSGETQVKLEGVTAQRGEDEKSLYSFLAQALEHTQLKVDAMAAGGALGAAVGVVKGNASATGSVSTLVSGGQYRTDVATFTAMAGRNTNNDSDALSLEGNLAGYGGALVAGIGVNSLQLTNSIKTNFTMTGAEFGDATAVDLMAGGHSRYDGHSDAIYAGLIASGTNHLDVDHGQQTTMTLAGAADGTAAGSFTALTQNSEEVSLVGEAAGGGLVSIDGYKDAVKVDHSDTSNATLNVQGIWNVADRMELAAATVSNVHLTADNTKGGLGVLSGATANNLQFGETKVHIDDGAVIKTDGDLAINATTDWSVGAAEGEQMVTSEVYGGIVGSGIRLDNNINQTNKVSVGKAAELYAEGSLFAESRSVGEAVLNVLSRTAGAFAGVGAVLNSTINVQNDVSIEENAKLKTSDADGAITLAASSDDALTNNAISRVEGAAISAAEASTYANYSRDNRVSIAKGADVFAGGELNLRAGMSANGEQANFNAINRAESFAYSGLAGIGADLSTPVTLNDVVDIEGTARSITNASVYADSGWWKVSNDSFTHYWGSLNNQSNSVVAVKGYGIIDQATPKESGGLKVDGQLLAGVNTKAEITLEGLISDGKLHVEGSQTAQTEPTITVDVGGGTEEFREEVLQAISDPQLSSESNVYMDRYNELSKLIQEYALLEGIENSALDAYKAEQAAILEIMESKGLVSVTRNEEGQPVVVKQIPSTEKLAIAVSGITVSGGEINISSQSVTGEGTISAKAAKGIKITNHTNVDLMVSDLHIYENGGSIRLNDVITNEEGIKTAGFAGTVGMASGAADPSIEITSAWLDGEYQATTTNSSGEIVTEKFDPKTKVTLSGVIENHANGGRISVDAQGDLLSLGDVSAAGSLSMKAGGSITQNYVGGLENLGGGIEGGQWSDEIYQISNEGIFIDPPEGMDVYSNEANLPGGHWVAGGDVIISGNLININGTVQSGFSVYEIDLDKNELADRINAIKAAWQNSGSPQNINVKSDSFLIQAGGSVEDDSGSFKMKVACWYDPINDRIVVDDIVPQGGHVYISGNLASTGGGNIYAMDGAASISLEASDWSVQTGVIDTGNVHGQIQLTDTFFADSKEGYAGRVTVYENGSAIQYMVNNRGEEVADTREILSDANVYSPKENLLYVWTEGQKTSAHQERHETWTGSWWSWDNLLPDQSSESGDGNTVTVEELTHGATITDAITRPEAEGSDSIFYAWLETTEKTDTGWVDVVKQWTSGFLGFYTHKSVDSTRDVGNTTVVTYTVKADQAIGVGFLDSERANSIQISTGKDLLLGGNLTATGGAIDLNAGGSILALSSGVSLVGADSIDLQAGGNIGSAGQAIGLSGGASGGSLALNASASGGVYLNGEHLSSGRDVNATIKAGGAVDVSVRNDLNITDITGQDISLASDEGSILIDSLVQTANIDGSQKFNASAMAGDITLTVTDGDLGVGLIEAAGDVSISMEKGSLYDAVREDSENAVANEDRLQIWKDAGLIGEDGEDIGDGQWEADVNKEIARIKSEFSRYETYSLMSEDKLAGLTDAQKSDFASLKAYYGDCKDDVAAVAKVEADESSNLHKLKASASNYGWTAEDLLYSIADTIINGTGTTTVGSTNIKGNNVTITVSQGSLGLLGDTVTGTLESKDPNRVTVLEYLSRADVGDFTATKDGVITVTLKDPVTIDASGVVNIQTQDNIFVETPQDQSFTIGEVVSGSGEVRITSQKGLLGLADATSLVSGTSVTLRGGEGGIGGADSIINIHTDEEDGWAAVSAEEDIFIRAVDDSGNLGDMTIYSLYGGDNVTIWADNLYAYQGDALEGYEDFSTLGYIRGETLNFKVSGDFGTEATALRLASSSTVVFEDQMQNLWLHAMGEGTLMLNGINASGVVAIEGDDALTINGGVTGELVSIGVLNDLTVGGSVHATGDLISLTSEAGNLSLADNASIEALGAVTLEAEKLLSIVGADIRSGDSVNISGNTISADGATVDALGDATLNAQGELNISEGAIASSEGKATLMAGGQLSATGTDLHGASGLTMSSSSDAIEAQQAILTSEADIVLTALRDVLLSDVTANGVNFVVDSETSSIDAERLNATLTGAMTFTSADELTLNSALVTASQLTATALNDVMAENGTFNISGGDAQLISEAGSLSLKGSTLTVEYGDLIAQAYKNLILSGVTFNVSGGELNVTAQTGDLDLRDSQGFKGESIEVAAGGNVLMSGLAVEVQDQLHVNAGQGIEAEGLSLTVGTADDSTPGDVTLIAQDGTINLNNADIKGVEANDNRVGQVVLSASEDILMTDLMAKDHQFTADSVQINAGNRIDWGENAQSITAIAGDISISAVSLEGNSLAAGTTLIADSGDLAIRLDRDLSIGEDFEARAQNIVFESENFSLADRSDVISDSDITIDATGGVAMTGDITVTGNRNVTVIAQGGDLTMSGLVTLGDESVEEAQAQIKLTALGSIIQSVRDGDAGVRGDKLTADAQQGAVVLDADTDVASGHFGNALNQADIESAADVVFSSYGRETALNVNASTNGAVNGDLLVYGDESGIRFGDALRVSGDAIVNASAVHGVSIEADGVVGIIAALYDHSISATDLSGISFTGALSGTEVSLYTDSGNIDVGKITSTSGHSDIYRLNTATIGFVNVNGIESNYTVAIYNGAGDVNLTAPVFGGNTVYSFTGNGVTHGSEYLLSAINKAAVIEGADKFSAHIDLSDLTLLSAGGLNSYALPHLVFDDRALEFADTDRITPFVYPIIETMSPTSEYFFLHLRSDAAAAKSDDEQEDDRVIEEGLPAKAKGVIRDLRPASEEINPAMLLSLK